MAHQEQSTIQNAAQKNGHPLFLLVDDAEDDTLLITQAFQKTKIPNSLKSVPSGAEAVRYLSGAGPYADRSAFPLPAIMLLDLKMPGNDGFAVLKWLRCEPSLTALRCIVLTDSFDPADIHTAYQLGACAFIRKPTSLRELNLLTDAIVEFWLRRTELPAPNSPKH